VFDLLFSQCDRHGQNLYLKPDGAIVLIDNDQVGPQSVELFVAACDGVCGEGGSKYGLYSGVCGEGGSKYVLCSVSSRGNGSSAAWLHSASWYNLVVGFRV
jgi:hypothetical protein